MPFFSTVGNEAQYSKVKRWVKVAVNGAASPLGEILAGSGAPNSGIGSFGDWYYDTANATIYWKSSSAVWRELAGASHNSLDPVSYDEQNGTNAALTHVGANLVALPVWVHFSNFPVSADSDILGIWIPAYLSDYDTEQGFNVQAALDTLALSLVSGLAAQDEASEINYDNTTSGLTATDVQAAIDEVYVAHDEASEISYDNATSGLTATDVQAAIDELVQDLSDGLDAQNEASEISYDNTTSGLAATDVQAAIDEVYAAHDEASEISYDNTTSGLAATDVQAAIDEVYAAHDEASEISYDGTTSGLSATDVQAAIDEVVDEQFTVAPRAWENTDWLTLISGAGAPSPSTGGPGWYYFDTTDEDLYGPAVFDGGIPGWDWGTALANVVFSATGPTNEAGDWYVWDENGDGSLYTLFQKKTTVNHDDIIRSQNGTSWDVVTPKVYAGDVYNDMQPIDPALGVMNGHQLFNQLWSNTAAVWGGYWSLYVEEEISGTYEVQAGAGNNFLLTLTGNTTLNLPTDMNAQMAVDPSGQMANRSSEISVLLKQGPSGPYTLTWGSMIVEPNGGLTITNHADEVDWFKFITFDNGTTWFASRLGHRYLP